MSKFTLKYQVNKNLSLELMGDLDEFETVYKKLNDEVLTYVSNFKTKKVNSEIVKEKVSKKNTAANTKPNKKNNNSDCKKKNISEYGVTEEQISGLINFCEKYKNINALEKVTLLLYWINKNSININAKLDKHIIYTFFYNAGDNINFDVQDGISNASRIGKAYIVRDKEHGYKITPAGVIFVEEEIMKRVKDE